MRPIFLTLLAAAMFISAIPVYSLNRADSLEAVVKVKSGVEKIDALNKLSLCYQNVNPHKGIEHASLALKMSNELNYNKGKADSYANLGALNLNLSNLNLSREYNQKALEIRKSLGDNHQIAVSLNALGGTLEQLGNYDKAVDCFFQAVEAAEKISDLKELTTSYSLLATIFYVLKDYTKSLEYCGKALMIREKIKDREGLANSYELMGMINYDISNYKESLKYHNLALNIWLSVKNKSGVAGSYLNLGLVNKILLKYDVALFYYNKSLKLSEELGDKRGLAGTITSIAQLYEKQGKDEQALEYFLKALQIRREIGDKRGIAKSFSHLSKQYAKMGDFKSAFGYQTLYYAYKDSLNNAKSLEKLTALSLQYKSEKKDKEIALLQKDNIIQKTVSNSLIAGFIFVTILAIVIFAAYRSKKKTNILLEEKNRHISDHHEELKRLNAELKISNATKDKFFSILAHDLRSPFTGLLGLSDEMAQSSGSMDKEEILEYSELINQSAKKIFELLNNLLEWSMLQSGRIEPKPGKLDLYTEVENVKNLFNFATLNKSISVINEVEQNTLALTDKDMIKTVLRNLISNSIKFTREGGYISISSKNAGDFIEVAVSDSGIGMQEEIIDNIFNIDSVFTTQGTNGEPGSGLGLVLCKELIERNGGKISVMSIPGEGTTFTFTLPCFQEESVEI